MLSGIFLLISIGVFMGVKQAYTAARMVFVVLMILWPGDLINFDEYKYSVTSNIRMGLSDLAFEVLFVYCFYCLGQHAKLKGLKK